MMVLFCTMQLRWLLRCSYVNSCEKLITVCPRSSDLGEKMENKDAGAKNGKKLMGKKMKKLH